MQPKTEQALKAVKKQNYFIRWVKNFLFIILGIVGFLGMVVLVGVVYLACTAINITPLVKYWMPLPVIKGVDKHHPAGRITFEKFVLSWPIKEQGLSAPLQLELKHGKLLDVDGQVQDHIQYAKIKLATWPLFHCVIEPLSLQLLGADLHLKRTKDQKIQLDIAGQKSSSAQSNIHINLRHFNQVIIQNSHIKLTDEFDNKTMQLKQIDMKILPFYINNTLGVVGHAMVQLDIDGRIIKLSAQSGADENIDIARQMLTQTGILKWHVQMDQVNPADFSGLSPSLQMLKNIDLPISVTANIGLKIGKEQTTIEPYDTQLMITMGKGKIGVNEQDLYPSSVKANIHAHFSPDLEKPVHLTIDEMSMQLRSPVALEQDKSGPIFQFKGSLFLSSLLKTKEIKTNFVAGSSELDFATIKYYWPSSIAKGAHTWVTENITKGHARGFKIEAGLASQKGWEHLDLVHLGGGISNADGVEIHWLRPVPPLKDIKASMQFVDPNRIHIQFHDGYQVVYPHNKPTEQYRKISVPKGDMWITGLSNHQEMGIISAGIEGQLQDLVALLYEPRLRLLSRHPLPFKHPSGEVYTTLKVTLPLKKNVKIDQISIQGHNEIRNAYFDNVALDRDLKNAFLTIDVDTRQLELSGKGIFSVFPVKLKYMQKFEHKNARSITEAAKAELDITPENLKQMQVDTSGDFSGHTALFVDYQKLYNGQATIKLKFDLLKSAIQLPIWQKNIGQPAMIVGEIGLDQSKLASIRNVYARGAGLSVNANIDVVRHIPQQINITSFQIGRSVGRASLNFPMTKEAIDNPQQGDIRLSVKADVLDAVPFVHQYTENDKKSSLQQKDKDKYQLPIAATGRYSGPRGRKWVVNLQAQKIYYNQDHFLSRVTAYMEYNGVRLMRLSYGMRKPFLVTASLFPKGQYRYFYLEAPNFGRMLEMVGMETRLKGGQAIFKGRFDDAQPSAPFNGKVTISDITLEDAPSAMRKLSDASIYGLFKNRKNKEIILDTLKGDLSFNDGILNITDGLVNNAELGATLQGEINLNQSLLALKGTIIPVYAVNKLFGDLPGVGKLFSPEKGGGFVALPFDIEGSFKKPEFDVYPSRVFTPGALRELF